MPYRSVPDPAPSLGLESLISGYQEADEQAATLLSKASARSCFAISWCRPPTGDMPTILQDTWMRFHKARHTYRPVGPVLPWIFAIARHAGLDNYRKERMRPDTPVASNQGVLHFCPLAKYAIAFPRPGSPATGLRRWGGECHAPSSLAPARLAND